MFNQLYYCDTKLINRLSEHLYSESVANLEYPSRRTSYTGHFSTNI